MASSTKMGKKVISQNELRRIMNEQKMKLTQSVKKIESPLARYSAKGQLSCILCDAPVKNEGLWTAHLSSRGHLANITAAKKRKTDLDSFKRPATSTFVHPPEKRSKDSSDASPSSSKSAIPADFFDSEPKAPVVKMEKQTAIKAEVPRQVRTEKFESANQKRNNVPAASSSKGQPKGANAEKEIADSSDPIPEGFFDDPKLDAKVRNVEYKDPVEEEWEKFMKAMKEESEQSHQIIQDDQEEATAERQLEEIDEQMRNWTRVIDLEKKKEEVEVKTAAADKIKKENDSDSDSEAGEDFDEFLDWRAKHS